LLVLSFEFIVLSVEFIVLIFEFIGNSKLKTQN